MNQPVHRRRESKNLSPRNPASYMQSPAFGPPEVFDQSGDAFAVQLLHFQEVIPVADDNVGKIAIRKPVQAPGRLRYPRLHGQAHVESIEGHVLDPLEAGTHDAGLQDDDPGTREGSSLEIGRRVFDDDDSRVLTRSPDSRILTPSAGDERQQGTGHETVHETSVRVATEPPGWPRWSSAAWRRAFSRR